MGNALRMTPEQVQERAKRLKKAKTRLPNALDAAMRYQTPKPSKPAKTHPGKPGAALKPDYPAILAKQIEFVGLPPPVLEYRFDPVRRFRFDLAWVSKRVAIEVDGGVWSQGRHTRGGGYLSDMEKLNIAAQQGWRVLRTTPQDVKNGKALELVVWAKKYWL